MKSKEFILWLRGFTEGVHEYNITPKQWDLLKEKLEEVDDAFVETPGMFQVHPEPPYPGVPVGIGGWGTPSGTTITTTPGTTGFVTIGNPSAMILSGSGQLWQVSTSTAYNPNSGSWHYTNGGNPDIKE